MINNSEFLNAELVSVIMPNYNGSKYIGETVASVVSQTYQNWELVFVDDFSRDNSVDVVKSFGDRRIRIFINNANRGAAYSRNYAVEQARGQYIAYLDSDDLWMPDKLEKQITFMKTRKCSFSCTKYQEIDDNDNVCAVVSAPVRITYFNMLCYDWIGCLTVMYDALAIGKVLLTVDSEARDDYAVFLEVSKRATCYCLDEILAQYRVHRNSLSRKSKMNLFIQNYKMYRLSEKKAVISAFFLTVINVLCWLWKRIYYRKSAMEREYRNQNIHMGGGCKRRVICALRISDEVQMEAAA